jgi:recombination associated protein RdgC
LAFEYALSSGIQQLYRGPALPYIKAKEFDAPAKLFWSIIPGQHRIRIPAMFRNLRFYRVTSPWPQSEEDLSEILSENAFTPCGSFSERSAGWEAIGNNENDPLCRRLNGADLFQLRTQSRVLPAAAIKEAVEERIVEYRSRMEQEPTRAEVRRLKEETRDKLLPKSLLKSERNRACFIHSESLLVIDVGTITKAEWVIDQLRASFEQFYCTPLTFNNSPGDLLTGIFMGDSPLGFSLGRECRMQDVMDSKSVVTWRDFELTDHSIRQHVVEGMRLTHLGVGFDEVMSCVIDQEGTVSKVKFIEGEAVDNWGEDPLAKLDADFVLLTGAIRRLIEDLKKLLGGFAQAA